jgi:hypothetical protein
MQSWQDEKVKITELLHISDIEDTSCNYYATPHQYNDVCSLLLILADTRFRYTMTATFNNIYYEAP